MKHAVWQKNVRAKNTKVCLLICIHAKHVQSLAKDFTAIPTTAGFQQPALRADLQRMGTLRFWVVVLTQHVFRPAWVCSIMFAYVACTLLAFVFLCVIFNLYEHVVGWLLFSKCILAVCHVFVLRKEFQFASKQKACRSYRNFSSAKSFFLFKVCV